MRWLSIGAAFEEQGVDLVYETRGAWRGWSLEWDRVSVSWRETLCRCLDCGPCSAKLGESLPPGRGLLIVRGVPWDYWRHGRDCNVCVFGLKAERIDGVVCTFFPLCIWKDSGKAAVAAAMCTGWALDDRWDRLPFHVLHGRVLGCLRI